MATTQRLQKSKDASIAFVTLLKACAEHKDLQRGSQTHAELLGTGLLQRNVYVSSTLINMYIKCGAITKAQEVFDELPTRNVVSWNSLISGHAQLEDGDKALACYDRMQLEGTLPHSFTFACVLKACGIDEAAEKGQRLHAQIVITKLLEGDHVLGTALVDMYAKCGLLTEAQEVFSEFSVQSIVSWNALIAGYAQHGCGKEALECYDQMQVMGISPNAVTYSCVLKACGSMGVLDVGPEIHAQIVRGGLLERDVVLANTLVDTYAKCGMLGKAQGLFDTLPIHNVVSWNTIIGAYAEHGHDEEALNCFKKMQAEGLYSENIPLACILKVCGNMGAADQGQGIHSQFVTDLFLEQDVIVGTALLDMYANCGMLSRAQEVFDKLPFPNLISWNALIAGYTQVGKDEIVLHLLDKMVGEGKEPNSATFVSMLNACSHGGLRDTGYVCFWAMSTLYGIYPNLEHTTCLIDLFGRVGRVDEAGAVMETMPVCANSTTWHTLMGACQKWGDVELGMWAFENAIQLDANDVAAYVSMRNMYATAEMQEDG